MSGGVFLAAGAVKTAVESLLASGAWIGERPRVPFGMVGALRDRILAGEEFDATVLSAEAIEQVAERGFVDRASIRPLGTTGMGLAVREGLALPAIETEAGLLEALARAAPAYPIAFGDRWDSPGGGVPGDGAIMIETLLRHPDVPAAVGVLWDPIAVSICRAAGPGSEVWLRIGGKATPVSGTPVDVHATVSAVTDDLVIPFEQSRVSFGPAASVSIGSLDIVLGSKRVQTFSPPAFTSLGIDLARKKMVVVKSSNHFAAAFAKVAADIHYLDSFGPFPHDPTKVTYRRLRRPIAPLDPNPWA